MFLIDLIKTLPKELAVLIAAATPIIEVRGSVPLGLGMGLPPLKTFLLSVLGSMLPVLPVLWVLNFLTDDMRKLPALDRFFEWLFNRTRAKSNLVKKYETLGLMLFVAVPLPVTGVWTGCAAAYLFGLSLRNTLIALILGTSIASGVVTLVFMAGAAGIMRLLHL